MVKAAFSLALVSLVLSSVAYWRSGGQQDVTTASRHVEEEIEALRAKQIELYESVEAMTRAAYERSQEQMQRIAESLRELHQEAAEELRARIDSLDQQLEQMKKKVATGLDSMKETSIEAARKTQEGLAKRIHRLDAQVDILRSKVRINWALASAERNDFAKTDEYLREAVESLNEARRTLGDDHAYDAKINALAELLRQALAAVKEKADDVQARIEKAVAESETLLSTLESDKPAAEPAAP